MAYKNTIERKTAAAPTAKNAMKRIAKKSSGGAISGVGATVTRTDRKTGKSTTTNKTLTNTSSGEFKSGSSGTGKKVARKLVRKGTGTDVTAKGFNSSSNSISKKRY